MRKHLLSLGLIAAMAVPALAKASFVDVSAFGGYTTLAMSELNAELEKGNPAPASVTKFNGGYYVGADAAFTIMPFLKIGPRLEYVAGSSKVTNGGSSSTFDASLIPLMLGVSTDWALPLTGLSVKAGVYAGYGMGTFKGTMSPAAYSYSASGNGMVAELDVQARYSILPTLSLGLDLGYRMAKIASMKVDSESPASPPTNVGKTLQNSKKEDIPVDFSGVNIGGALAFNF